MTQGKKLDILRKSHEEGIIDKEEYEKVKEKIEPDAEEFDKIVEETNKEDEPKKSSEIILVASIVVVVLLFGALIAFSVYHKQRPKTLEELHILNLKGKLDASQGYVYKGAYSFVTLDSEWYTQLISPKGTKIYSLALRYSPRDLKDIVIEGTLNTELFDSHTEYYVTFNPTGKDFSYVALAIADFNTHMMQVFEKRPVAACDRNETEVCKTRPIITCEDSEKLVLYIKESDRFRTYYNNNCIVVEGNGLDLVKGVDRVLYDLYNIMEQEES